MFLVAMLSLVPFFSVGSLFANTFPCADCLLFAVPTVFSRSSELDTASFEFLLKAASSFDIKRSSSDLKGKLLSMLGLHSAKENSKLEPRLRKVRCFRIRKQDKL